MKEGDQPSTIPQLLDFLARLSSARIHYTLACVRPDAVMIRISVPGERWEVELMSGGWLEIEVFRSIGGVQDEALLERLFKEFSD